MDKWNQKIPICLFFQNYVNGHLFPQMGKHRATLKNYKNHMQLKKLQAGKQEILLTPMNQSQTVLYTHLEGLPGNNKRIDQSANLFVFMLFVVEFFFEPLVAPED